MLQSPAPAENLQKVAPIAQKFRLGEQPSDFTYWQTQSYAARLLALEQMRQSYIAWNYDSEPGFQRVYTIIKR